MLYIKFVIYRIAIFGLLSKSRREKKKTLVRSVRIMIRQMTDYAAESGDIRQLAVYQINTVIQPSLRELYYYYFYCTTKFYM